MNNYLRNLMFYFENVLHPASGWSSDSSTDKRKRKVKRSGVMLASPDGYNIRGGMMKKGDKLRRNPAP